MTTVTRPEYIQWWMKMPVSKQLYLKITHCPGVPLSRLSSEDIRYIYEQDTGVVIPLEEKQELIGRSI